MKLNRPFNPPPVMEGILELDKSAGLSTVSTVQIVQIVISSDDIFFIP